MFEVLYNLSNENFSVVEIKLTKSPSDAEKSDLFSWFHIDIANKKIEKLIFQSMREEDVQDKVMNIRIFKDAELRFDKMFGRFISNSHEHILMNCAAEALSKESKELIDNYIK
jgi:hypothetical protein